MDVQLAVMNAQLNGARTLVGKLRNTLNRFAQLLAIERDLVRMILGKHAVEVGKISRELAAQQQTVAKLKEQVIVVARKLHQCVRIPILLQLQNFSHRFARQKRLEGTGDAR